jgi:hypothetical protein
MTFGLLKHFKDAKSGSTLNMTSNHYRHIILGHDLGAVLKLFELRRTHPQESVRLITTRPLNRESLVENYDFGVTQLRSSSAIEGIYRKFHDAKISSQKKDASFFKDGKFHDFGSRAKSMELKGSEDFFIPKGHRLKLSTLFTPEEWENFDLILNDHSETQIFESIDKTTPADLVDKAEWKLSFKDFSSATTENLYLSLSPKKFLGLLHNKEVLTSELVDVCSSVKVQAAISVTWKLDKEFGTDERTLFIPQSMTHEWGHFIVEFESFDHHSQEQLCHVLFLIHDESPQAEDLAQKIKLMKRVLDRVYPDIEKHIKKEFIRFDEEMFISDVKDTSLEQLAFDYPTLKFLGQSSPMSGIHTDEKFLSRILLN